MRNRVAASPVSSRRRCVGGIAVALSLVLSNADLATAQGLDSTDFTNESDYKNNEGSEDAADEPSAGTDAEIDIDREEEPLAPAPGALDAIRVGETDTDEKNREADEYDTDGDGVPDDYDPSLGK